MADLDKILSPKDTILLDPSGPINWVPKNPRDLILPYIEKDPPEEDTQLENKRVKAKQVAEAYDKLIDKCKEIEAEIEERCKNVTIPVSPNTHFTTIQSISRVFGIPESEVKEITFEMYKTCIKEFAALNDSGIPGIGES